MNDTWYYYKPFKKDMGGGLLCLSLKLKLNKKICHSKTMWRSEWVGFHLSKRFLSIDRCLFDKWRPAYSFLTALKWAGFPKQGKTHNARGGSSFEREILINREEFLSQKMTHLLHYGPSYILRNIPMLGRSSCWSTKTSPQHGHVFQNIVVRTMPNKLCLLFYSFACLLCF